MQTKRNLVLGVRVDADTRKWLERQAEKEDRDVSYIVRRALASERWACRLAAKTEGVKP